MLSRIVYLTRNVMAYCYHGMYHRKDGPAYIMKDYGYRWLQYDLSTRNDGPASMSNDMDMFWTNYNNIKKYK